MNKHSLLPVLATALLTSACVMEPAAYGPPPPGYGGGYNNSGWNNGYNRPGNNDWNNGNYSSGANSSSTYRVAGNKHGQSDRARGLSHDPGRYFGTVPPQFQRAFASGYSSGYGQVAQAQDTKYYQGGSVTGASDFQKGLSYDPSRYAATVPFEFRNDFSRGYANGWRAAGGR